MPIRPDLFENVDFDKAAFDADLRREMPRRKLGILFTPRSGSSWLTDILHRTRRLGKPNEWFNPNFIPAIAKGVNADSLERYIAMIQRKHMLGRVFSFEVTIYQLMRVFRTEAAFVEHFPADIPWVYLRREDMVAQAVSLAKAVRTDVYHAPQTSASDVARADEAFTYDGAEIDKWLGHVLDQERKSEAFLARNGISPLRLNYEGMFADGAETVVRQIMSIVRPRQVDLPEQMVRRLQSNHRKIGTDKNRDFATRFARDYPHRLDEIAAFRATCPC